MDVNTYKTIENYMLRCMTDKAHDKEHVYRVLYQALDIAEFESEVDYDILITACLLHDIGREAQFRDPNIDHALAGGSQAFEFLIKSGFNSEYAEAVKACIETHRFRSDNPPVSTEAKILFDSDKLEAAGAIGIARTIMYAGQTSVPLYTKRSDGTVSDGAGDIEDSFFSEYKYKLANIYERFFTKRANEISVKRQKAAVSFYKDLLSEVRSSYEPGMSLLDGYLTK